MFTFMYVLDTYMMIGQNKKLYYNKGGSFNFLYGTQLCLKIKSENELEREWRKINILIVVTALFQTESVSNNDLKYVMYIESLLDLYHFTKRQSINFYNIHTYTSTQNFKSLVTHFIFFNL